MGVSVMTDVMKTPTQQPRSTVNGWMVLIIGSMVGFLLGAGTQLATYIGFGLCMESDEALCEPGTVPTTFEWVLATVPSYLLWLTPSLIAGYLGYRALRSGNPAGRTLLGVATLAVVLITVACTLMWWL
jgi:hypothetical protein